MKTCSTLRPFALALAGVLLSAPLGCAGKPAPAPASAPTNLNPAEIRGGGGDPNARRDSMGKMVQEKMDQNKKDATEGAKDTPPEEKPEQKPEEK